MKKIIAVAVASVALPLCTAASCNGNGPGGAGQPTFTSVCRDTGCHAPGGH